MHVWEGFLGNLFAEAFCHQHDYMNYLSLQITLLKPETPLCYGPKRLGGRGGQWWYELGKVKRKLSKF